MPWPTGVQKFGPNRVPLLHGLASDGSGVAVPIAVDKTTGDIYVQLASGSLGATASAAAPAYLEGSSDVLSLDLSGNLRTTLGALLAGEDLTNDVIKTENRNTYQNITTTATTLLKTGAGLLHALTINKPVASSVITIYDNTAASGTIIATITLPATLLSEGPMTAIYDVAFSIGLTILTATGASDITASYR